MKLKLNRFSQTSVIIIFIFAIISCIQISSAADWPMYYKDANHSALNPANGAKTDNVLWKFEIGELLDPLDSRGFNHSFAIGPPVIADGAVYVRTIDNYVYSVDANSGKLKWKFKTPGHEFHLGSSLSVVDGTVYVGSSGDENFDTEYKSKGYFDALDAETGKLKWEFLTGNCIDSTPAVDNGIVYFGSDGIYALDANDGKLSWKYETNNIVIQQPLTILDGNLYYYSNSCDTTPNSGCVYALDTTNGELKWKQGISEEVSDLLASNGIIFIRSGGHDNGCVYALDALNGNIKWNNQLNSFPSSIFVSNGILFFTIPFEDVSKNSRFEAKLLIGENNVVPVLDGGDIEGFYPLQIDESGIWQFPFVLTENGADKLRNAVLKYQVYDQQSDIIFYLDGELMFKVPFSRALAKNIQFMPVRNTVINIGPELDAENKTRAEELIKVFVRDTNEMVGLDINSGILVSNAIITAPYEFGEDSLLRAEERIAHVEGITYTYSRDLPIYLLAIGEKMPPEIQPNNSKSVAGFEISLAMTSLLILYILNYNRFIRR